MPVRLRSRVRNQPTTVVQLRRRDDPEDNSLCRPVAFFFTSPHIVIILFRPSSPFSSRRFFNRYPGILIARERSLDLRRDRYYQPVTSRSRSVTRDGGECETRFGFEFDRLDKKTETDFLDPSPSRNLLCLSIETLLLNR